MDEEVVIRISGVRKRYALGKIDASTLQAEWKHRWVRRRGIDAESGKFVWALDGVDLTVRRGEKLGIIGANGAGKSTLLKLLCRLTAPTEGEIDLCGRVSSILEVGTGFHWELTGRENVYMNGAILGVGKAEIDAKLDDIVAFSEVGAYLDTPVKRYSSGMLVKLAFAVAVTLRSEIMVMDEVLAVGDAAFQRKCLERLRAAAEADHSTVLYVSHNMESIRRLCDRAIVLERGRIVCDGDVEPAIGRYLDSAAGGGGVDWDLTRAEHRGDRSVLIERLTVLDKTVPVFSPDEILRFRLTVRSVGAGRTVRLRLTLRSDADVAIGTAWSAPFTLGGGVTEREFCLPLPLAASGTVYGSVGLYARGDTGDERAADHVTRACKLKLLGRAGWSAGAYGFVALPDIKTI